jgi:hypothetical protein
LQLPQESSEETALSVKGGAESGALTAPDGHFDAQLAEIVPSWPKLPEVVRADILAKVRLAQANVSMVGNEGP